MPTSDGDLRRRQRRLMAPEFQPAHVGRFAADMVACTARYVASWPDGAAIDVPRETTRITTAEKAFKEALRLYPPVPVLQREAAEPVAIGGVPFRRGACMAAFPWAVHHREPVRPAPGRFDPERFTAEAEAARARCAWIPFGAGPRVCIGNYFSLLEGPIVPAAILRRVRLEPLDDAEEVGPDAAALTPRPRAFRMRVRARAASDRSTP